MAIRYGKRMAAKFPGTCKICRLGFPVGTAILWMKGYGSTHVDDASCAAAIEVERIRAANAVSVSVPPAKTVSGAGKILAFLLLAKSRGLKFPKVRFLAPDGKGELRMSVAGEKARVPGSVNVVVNGDWIGRINPDSTVTARLGNDIPLMGALEAIAADPVSAAKAYGAMMSRCTFCSLPLTDAGSVEVGYGKVCADRYDLPHVTKGTPEVATVPVEGMVA